MEKRVKDDEVSLSLKKAGSCGASCLHVEDNGVASGNGASVKCRRQLSGGRGEEAVGQLRRRRRGSSGAFLSSLDSTSVEERLRSSGAAASRTGVLAGDEGQTLHTYLQDVDDPNSIARTSGGKWVVRKKDKSSQVSSDSKLSSRSGRGLDIRRRSGVSLLHQKQSRPSLLHKGDVGCPSNSNRKKASGGTWSGEVVMPSHILARKQEKIVQHQSFAPKSGKKRSLEDTTCHRGGKNIDARSSDKRKQQENQKRSKKLKKENKVKEESNGHLGVIHEDDEENLERNAARMLSSRFDPRCTSHSVCRKTVADSITSHFRTMHNNGVGQVFKSGKQNGNNPIRRRRHFYEVFAKDIDPYWVLTRRIKVFWPLDQIWYFGLVKDYNPSTGLHNVKYDDHEEEWINLQIERFKLLLFPSEFKCKFIEGDNHLTVKREQGGESASDGDCEGSIIESEPIISWLARSIRRVKTSSLSILKEKKRFRFNRRSLSDALPDKSTMFSGPAVGRRVAEEPMSKSGPYSLDRRFCYHYSRRRSYQGQKDLHNEPSELNNGSFSSPTFSKMCDLGLLLEFVRRRCEVVVLSSTVLQILNLARMAGTHCLYNVLRCYQYGSLVVLWPRTHMEILILDNVTGLRFMSYVGCLIDTITLMCLIMSLFYMPGNCEETVKLPVTSIGFKLSRARQRSANHLFSMQLFQQYDQSKWVYLDKKLKRWSVLMTKFPLSACTLTNISNFAAKSYLISLTPVFKEGARKGPLADIVPLEVPQRLRKSAANIIRCANQENLRTVVCFAKESLFFLNWHLKFLMKIGAKLDISKFDDMSRLDCQNCDRKFKEGGFSFAVEPVFQENVTSPDYSDAGSQCSLNTTNIHHRQIAEGKLSDWEAGTPFVPDQLAVDVSVAGCTASSFSRKEMNDYERSSISPSYSHYTLLSDDLHREGSFSGYRKPRTQVSYSLPHERFNIGPNHQNSYQSEHPCKRIRIENSRRFEPIPRGSKNSLSSLRCEANVLATEVDKGRRYVGAEVVLHFDDKDWKILIKIAGITRYTYKAHQFMQPGITNRDTHAMMWKGGRDWILEFTERSQWVVFREMHEECYNRNIKAPNLKNIPIPGVCLIEDSDMYDDKMPFIRSSLYVQQIGTEVDMAMDPYCIIYDMDSDDEVWVSNMKAASERDGKPLDDLENMFEREIDMLEKLSYSHKCDKFIDSEIESLLTDVGPLNVTKCIYEYWQRKRQKKEMPLIRQFQPPLWEWYQKQLKEWEMATCRIVTSVNGSRAKVSVNEKPPMFAFCLKPRGMDISNKGLKQRSHKKMTVSVNQGLYAREQELAFGKRLTGLYAGNDWISDSPAHYHSPTGVSASNNMGTFSRDYPKTAALANARPGRFPNLKTSRSNSMRIGPISSSDREFQMTPTAYNQKTRRSLSCRWNSESHGWMANTQDGSQNQTADIEEFRLRDASGAAQHATNMAKLKREKAQWLLHKADLALHKAVVALTTAEAMKASERDLIGGS